MSSSTSHKKPGGHSRGAHGGGGSDDGQQGGGGGGGGGGPLVKVAYGRNQSEAELMQGLLSEEGIPSILKRSGGFDNPDFLAAGPHDVFVTEQIAPRAREVLADLALDGEAGERAELEAMGYAGSRGGISTERFALWFAVAVLGAIALIWVLYELRFG
jgi:hypothetical protein